MHVTDPYEAALELFGRGLYWEAHEGLEDLWNEAEGTERTFYQGLIQLAAALHCRAAGKAAGAEKNFRDALEKLERVPEVHGGLDIVALRAAVERRDPDLRLPRARA